MRPRTRRKQTRTTPPGCAYNALRSTLQNIVLRLASVSILINFRDSASVNGLGLRVLPFEFPSVGPPAPRAENVAERGVPIPEPGQCYGRVTSLMAR